jgi:hypothetical protein
MAGLGRKTFVAGDVLLAQELNDYLMDQSVMNFGGSAARSSAIPTPTSGMVSYLTDERRIEVYDGDIYRPKTPFAMEAGTVSITPVANSSTGVAVTFATGRFTQTPKVNATANSAANALRTTTFSGPSPTGVTIRVFRTDTVGTGVDWIAIQMTSSSGEG